MIRIVLLGRLGNNLFQYALGRVLARKHGVPLVMDCQGKDANQHTIYTATVTYGSSGLQGLSLRVLPKHRYLSSVYEPRQILWAAPH